MTAQAELDPENEAMSTVTLGDVQFDPVSVSDFRLSIEGTSNVGKSNTLAVVLEDLADVQLPTLIIERLGALTPVRFEDEDLIVVGAREEEGIDLPVALEELDRIGEWVLDHGRKLLLDISTYADYEDEKSRVHLAAAKALRSLNDRAHEKYRSGDRTKSLLVVDEAHILAPKDSAPEPALDDYVKRCRGQLIKAATEGGNKGISIVTAYQRRAFLHNGVIQLCEDYVAHKPGDEDIDRTAKALRCDPDQIASLGTGEILARGTTITGGDLVDPTLVRKRRSPDPREETFELPEVSGETEAFLAEISADIEADRERRQQRQDELERLREENERLQEQVEELQQELADTDRLATALDNLQFGGNAARDVGEGVEWLQERVDELKAERVELTAARAAIEEEKEAAEAENQHLQETIADLEAELQELRAAFDGAAENIRALAETFDVDDVDLATTEVAADADAEGRREDVLAEREARIEELEATVARLLNGEGGVEPLSGYAEFLEDDDVQAVIGEAKRPEKSSPRYIKGVIATILDEQGPVTYEEVADRLGLKRTNEISSAATLLESYAVVEKENTSEGMRVDLNVEGLQEVREKAAARRRTDDLMESL